MNGRESLLWPRFESRLSSYSSTWELSAASAWAYGLWSVVARLGMPADFVALIFSWISRERSSIYRF